MPIERLTRAGATSVLGARDSFTHKMPASRGTFGYLLSSGVRRAKGVVQHRRGATFCL
jgi:hypothetical protein